MEIFRSWGKFSTKALGHSRKCLQASISPSSGYKVATLPSPLIPNPSSHWTIRKLTTARKLDLRYERFVLSP
ncbi:hypothetical protein FRC19_004704 [Serendipita sp. 401]|nr:hypothetical protein FRC19_004704 [Serendipita sp. 401]